MRPHRQQPTGSAVPGILQARVLEWAAISFSNAWKWKVKVKPLSCVRLLATPWTAAHQAPLSMGFSRQEYWSGVPLPSPILLVPKSKLSFSCSILNLRKQKLFLLTLSEFYSFLCNLHLVHTFIISLAMLILVYLLTSLLPVISQLLKASRISYSSCSQFLAH